MNIEELKNEIELKEKELKKLKEELEKIINCETAIIINKNTNLENFYELRDKIKEICTGIKIFEELGIKKLSYPIAENTEAFFVRFEWEGTRDNVLELEKYFRANDNVLKFTTIWNPCE